MAHSAKHDYQIGDSILADFGGAQIPGVIESIEDERLYVRLAQPWADETGKESDTAWLTPDQVAPSMGDSGTVQLPG